MAVLTMLLQRWCLGNCMQVYMYVLYIVIHRQNRIPQLFGLAYGTCTSTYMYMPSESS